MFYHNINPALIDFGQFQIRYYGLFYAAGFIMAYFMIIYLAGKKNLSLSRDDVSDFLVYIIAGVVLGARITYILFYNPQFYIQNPFEIFALWHGGLSFHGGFLGAIAATLFFCKRRKAGFYEIADIVVLPVALGLALGRLGNFINGELYGRITDVGWCIDYSRNIFLTYVPEGCRHPSQIYASIKNLIIFSMLWLIKDKRLPKGFMFWAFVALYGFLRTIVEFFRQPDAQVGFIFGNFTMGQLLSLPLFAVGSIMAIQLILNRKG